MIKNIQYFVLSILLFCSFECSTIIEDNITSSEENVNILHINEVNVSKELDISVQLDPILNDFSPDEDPFDVWYERNALATSLILEYIREKGGLTIDVIESIPVSKSYVKPYIHFTPDNLFHVHSWLVPYAETIHNYQYSYRFWEGYTKLNITIIQYTTNYGEKVFISIDDIINILDIPNIKLMNSIKESATISCTVEALNNNMYLFSFLIKYDRKDYIGTITFVIKFDGTKFILQKALNNENYLILFTDIARSDKYVLNGGEMNSECIIYKAYKIVGEKSGSSGREDLNIYDCKEIKLIFNGNEFIGDYEYLLELSKNSEPPNFNINTDIIMPQK
jgi:hypothetical protein